MTLVAMNDDKHNDVWVSCCHGNSTSLGMVSQRVLSLSMNNKLPVAAIGHLVEVCYIHSANKQFFGIGKV